MRTEPTVRDVQLLHIDPFGGDMLASLKKDMQESIWLRFMICYFTPTAAETLAPHLAERLCHPRSRGLFTLTCSCGSEAIETLASQRSMPYGRLRTFLRVDGRGPEDAKSIHSKMVLFIRPRSEPDLVETPLEAVLYVGSHNWTGAGLGIRDRGRGGVNVETSIRVVADWDPEFESHWLHVGERHGEEGRSTGNVILDAIGQIHRCFELASCTDMADRYANEDMGNWLRANCQNKVKPPGSTPFLVSTAVLAADVDGEVARSGWASPQAYTNGPPRVGETLYVQHYRGMGEPDVFDTGVTWAFLVWETRDALHRAEAPWLLLGRARNMGERDVGDPNLRQVQWITYDPGQNVALGERVNRQHLTVPSSRLLSGGDLEVEYWSMAPVRPGVASGELDARTPDQHALVEIMAVRRPLPGRAIPDDEAAEVAQLATITAHDAPVSWWYGIELPFHQQSRRRRSRVYVVHDEDGPSRERADAMREEQATLFGVGQGSTWERVWGTTQLDLDHGPVGESNYKGADVYRCRALINDVLFQRYRHERTIPCPDTEHGIVFEVERAGTDTRDREQRRVPRMERLIAPNEPYVAKRLGLSELELTKLRFKV